MHLNSDVVHIFSAVDFESRFIVFVADTKFDFASEHHLAAIHVISHAVFKIWHMSLGFEAIEIDQVFGCDIYSYIAFRVADEIGNFYTRC